MKPTREWWGALTPEEREHTARFLVQNMLVAMGDDPTREGLQDTPKRVVKSWLELFAGYNQDPRAILGTTFKQEGYKTDEIVLCKNIEFYSTCEHHLQNITGRAHIGYLPGERVVGLSKLARLVDCFARRLQIQEAMTSQIADALEEVLQPRGVVVVLDAKHNCMCARGIGKQNSSMVTSAMRGVFRENPAARSEVLALIKD